MSISIPSLVDPRLPLLGAEVLSDPIEALEVPALNRVEDRGHANEGHGDGSAETITGGVWRRKKGV